MLKNPRALDTADTFLHAIYLRQNSKFSQLLFAAIFLLNNVIGACLLYTSDAADE